MTLRIRGFIWLDQFVEKLIVKHGVETSEVEELFYGRYQIDKVGRGKIEGEHLYQVLGRTEAGRYLLAIFIYKPNDGRILVISARDMAPKERKQYGR
jgi:uncharacterized DUF497 family protein